MNTEEQKSEASQRFFADVYRKNTQPLKHYRLLLTPWDQDTYHALQDFAIVSVKLQKGTVTLLINGKQVAQKSLDFPLAGSSLGLFAGGDSIVEARSFRVDKVIY